MIKKKVKETKIKGRSATYTYWDDTGKSEPLTKELMEKIFKDLGFDKKPPKFIYFTRKATRLEMLWYKIQKFFKVPILSSIELLDSITGHIIGMQRKLFDYFWKI